jgi:UDP-2,3-diacylglucosamine hydrolase
MNLDFSISEENKKIYFASDFHLGAPNKTTSLSREKKIIKWLDTIKGDASTIFLVGDIFDFWFEYTHVIPKGFARFQGKIAELTDSGIAVIFFTGNHDLWMKDYFIEELGVQIFTQPQKITINDKKFLVGHGDGLGSGDYKYKIYKRVFLNPICQWFFRWLHADIGITLASLWSRKSRAICEVKADPFLGKEEKLIEYCESVENKEHFDYYIFGHRHLPIDYQLNNNSRYFNLGQWFNQCNFGVFNGSSFELKSFEPHD